MATEVRTLAQRSAAAAKEIKMLIGANVDKVESGSKLANDAGLSMTNIVTQVKRVNDLIGEISAASKEQSVGIGQVGDAVNQLDRVTQQNAALVEESAAAAESLKVQAAQLTQMVAVFTVSWNAVPADNGAAFSPPPGAFAMRLQPKAKPAPRANPARPVARTPVPALRKPVPRAPTATPNVETGAAADWAAF